MLWELGFKIFLYLLFQNVIGCFYNKKVRKTLKTWRAEEGDDISKVWIFCELICAQILGEAQGLSQGHTEMS